MTEETDGGVDRGTPDDVGMRVRREVLGDAHVDAAVAATTDLTADFQAFLTRYAWGEVWSRPGLDRRTRRLLTVAMLAALGRDEELVMHVRAGLRAAEDGLTVDDLRETLLQVAVYAGLPAANHAFALVGQVLDAAGDPEGHLPRH